VAIAPAEAPHRQLRMPGRPRGRRRGWDPASGGEFSGPARIAAGVLGIVLVLVIWQLLSDTGTINPRLWSSPKGVWEAFWELLSDGTLWPACWSSLRLFGQGFLIAAVGSVAIGILLGWYRRLGAVFDPWVSMLYAAPRVGLIPIIIGAAGIGSRSQIIVVVISASFPIIVNTAVGVNAVEADYVRTAQSFLAKNRDVLRTIALPGAMPLIFAGLRQGLTAGLIGVVIAEYFLGNEGVGGLMIAASGSGRPAQAFVGALLFALAAVIFTSILRLIERRVSKWH
jgi:ABC-type nitrate/sulfonate/bicarbonate transport system permease component